MPVFFRTIVTVCVIIEYFTPILAGSDLPNILTISFIISAAYFPCLVVEVMSVMLKVDMKYVVKSCICIPPKIKGFNKESIMLGGGTVAQMILRIPFIPVRYGPFDIGPGDFLHISSELYPNGISCDAN